MKLNQPNRKPPKRVYGIDRKPAQDDLITQAELQRAADFQLTVWHAERECREYIKGLAHRLELGARIEDGGLLWDEENEMVRSKKKESAG